MNYMNNQVVFVSGASRGIGRAIAIHFAEIGCKVIGTSRSDFEFDNDFSGNLISMKLDITCRDSVKSCAEQLKEKNLSPTVLINNCLLYTSPSPRD